jgi:hypothetical protein
MTALNEEVVMKSQRILMVLTAFNFAMLGILLFNNIHRVEASSVPAVLRARALEIVDAKGRVRASINVVPAGPAIAANGSPVPGSKVIPETVRFRLIRPDGRPSVKITTSEEGSGLTLGGGANPTYIVLDANGGFPSLSLINEDGHQQLIKP